jgi:hypothetical protein
MRILVTSMSSACLPTRRATWASFSTLLPDILRAAGHQVTWSEVTPGEKLDYDFAFIDVFNLQSMMSFGYRWGAAWTGLNVPHACVLSDWQFEPITRNLTPDSFWRVRMPGKRVDAGITALRPYESRINNLLQYWRERAHWILPLFNWGHHRFPIGGSQDWVDPSAFLRMLGKPRPKHPHWIFASLTKHDQWLKKLRHTWPIVPYVGDDKVDEEFLVSECYSEAAGIISHPYAHCGSGWWRARFTYAAQVRSILATFGESPLQSYNVCIPAVEAMDIAQRRDLAEFQAREYASNEMPKDAIIAKINDFIEGCK